MPRESPPDGVKGWRHKVPRMSVELILIGFAVIATVAALFVVLRTVVPLARELQHLRILSEQARDGTRTEGETTRAHLRAQSTEGIERLTTLRGALDTSLRSEERRVGKEC